MDAKFWIPIIASALFLLVSGISGMTMYWLTQQDNYLGELNLRIDDKSSSLSARIDREARELRGEIRDQERRLGQLNDRILNNKPDENQDIAIAEMRRDISALQQALARSEAIQSEMRVTQRKAVEELVKHLQNHTTSSREIPISPGAPSEVW